MSANSLAKCLFLQLKFSMFDRIGDREGFLLDAQRTLMGLACEIDDLDERGGLREEMYNMLSHLLLVCSLLCGKCLEQECLYESCVVEELKRDLELCIEFLDSSKIFWEEGEEGDGGEDGGEGRRGEER
jgi:hypothetical protein